MANPTSHAVRVGRQLLISLLALSGVARSATPPPNPSDAAQPYVAAVRAFADNVLALGTDHYGATPTPLFVDGIDVDTHEPVKWKSHSGHEWALSDFASQQNLLRTLDGLTGLTGDPRYRTAGVAAARYALDHLMHDGLMGWGGHTAYNASDARLEFAENKGNVHELKSHYPYYEFLWQVNPAKTKLLMENIWRGHILNWSNLDFNRHASKAKPGKLWDNDYVGGTVFFWGNGLTFHNAGSDLYYDAAILFDLSKEEGPLVWAKRLAHRYVETRNPKTGLGGYQFSQMKSAMCDEFAHPEIKGDRAEYFFAADFPGHLVVEGTLFPTYGDTPETAQRICQMTIADRLGAAGHEFSQWAVEELTAWGKSAFRASDCSFIPMLTDGTNMEGYVVKKDGYFGPTGRVYRAGKAKPAHFWAYAMAFRQSGDAFMWEMTRAIALGNNLGDIGAKPETSAVTARTGSSDPDALLGFLELYRATKQAAFLEAAKRVGDNILKARFNSGLFVARDRQFASFDRVEPLALLHLAAAIMDRAQSVPAYPGGAGFYSADYGTKLNQYDSFIYALPRRAARDAVKDLAP